MSEQLAELNSAEAREVGILRWEKLGKVPKEISQFLFAKGT